jgi:hypothetical protein
LSAICLVPRTAEEDRDAYIKNMEGLSLFFVVLFNHFSFVTPFLLFCASSLRRSGSIDQSVYLDKKLLQRGHFPPIDWYAGSPLCHFLSYLVSFFFPTAQRLSVALRLDSNLALPELSREFCRV